MTEVVETKTIRKNDIEDSLEESQDPGGKPKEPSGHREGISSPRDPVGEYKK